MGCIPIPENTFAGVQISNCRENMAAWENQVRPGGAIPATGVPLFVSTVRRDDQQQEEQRNQKRRKREPNLHCPVRSD
jgi:hypothetical protein